MCRARGLTQLWGAESKPPPAPGAGKEGVFPQHSGPAESRRGAARRGGAFRWPSQRPHRSQESSGPGGLAGKPAWALAAPGMLSRGGLLVGHVSLPPPNITCLEEICLLLVSHRGATQMLPWGLGQLPAGPGCPAARAGPGLRVPPSASPRAGLRRALCVSYTGEGTLGCFACLETSPGQLRGRL